MLLARAMKNQMTNEEYAAAYYAFAPHWLKVRVFESLMGYEPADLRLGGKFQALTRHKEHDRESIGRGDVDGTVSYYGKAWALKEALIRRLQAEGRPQDESVQIKAAISIIRSDIPKHLKMTPLFAWRGIWSFGGLTRLPVVAVNLLAFGILILLPLRVQLVDATPKL